MDRPTRTQDRIGPHHVGVVRAVARWMMPSGRAYTDDEVDLAAAVLLPAVTAGHTSLRLRWGSTPQVRMLEPRGPVLEVTEGERVVAEIPWRDLEISDRPLAAPGARSTLTFVPFAPSDD